MTLRDEELLEISNKLAELQTKLEKFIQQPITSYLKSAIAAMCKDFLYWCMSMGYGSVKEDDNVLVLHDLPEKMKYTFSTDKPETLSPAGDFNSLDIIWPAWFKKILERND